MKSTLYFFIFSILLLSACKESDPQPSDLVGRYVVSGRLSKDVAYKDDIKAEIKEALKEASAEMAKAKNELVNETDFNSIDTSTTEGKIEYTAKKISHSIAEIGLTFGEATKDMGELFSNLATEGLGLGESLIKNMKLEVELQADGVIRAKSTLINLGLEDVTWEVKGDEFILHKGDNESADVFIIKNRSNTGFTIVKDDISIDFNRKS